MEFAVALPAVIVILALSLSLMAAAAGRTGLQEYARQAARLSATGLTQAQVTAQLGSAPGTLNIAVHPPHVTATVTRTFTLAGMRLPTPRVQESATAYLESSIAGLNQ